MFTCVGSWSAGVTVSNFAMVVDLKIVHTYGTTCRNTLKPLLNISMGSDWTTATLHHYMLLRYSPTFETLSLTVKNEPDLTRTGWGGLHHQTSVLNLL